METDPLITTEVQNMNPAEGARSGVNPGEINVPILLKVILTVEWLIYIATAPIIAAFSSMAGDSSYASEWQVFLPMLLINGIPVLALIGTTILSLKRKSYFFALLPVVIVFSWPIFFLIMGPMNS